MKFIVTFMATLLASTASAFVKKSLPDTSPPVFEPASLQKREPWPLASNEVWSRAQCKGSTFVRAFPMSDAAAGQTYTPPRTSAQSCWTGDLKNHLAKWGWTENAVSANVCRFDDFTMGKGFVDMEKDLGIKLQGMRNIWCYQFSHGTAWSVIRGAKYKVDGKEYLYTGAYAQFGVNAADGAIFAMDNLMPSFAFKKNKGRDPFAGELPALQSLSDLLWGGWYRGSQPNSTPGNPNAANIKYLLSVQVTNSESLSIIKRALDSKQKPDVSLWPGDTFDASTPEGQALLGSPNGKRWGYFVIQRKNDIGIKKIDRVTVFKGKEVGNPSLVFYVR